MKNAVLFDFDGTLFFGTPKLNSWCFADALAAMGLPPATKEKIDQTIGLTFPQIARLMTGSEEESVLSRFEEEVFAAVPRYIERYIRPDEGVKAMLAALEGKATLAICSNATPRYLLPMLDALALTAHFEIIWYHRAGVTKAQAIPILMERLGAQRAVFVGDRLEDVEAARAAGIPVVGIRNAAYPWEVDGADAVVTQHADMQDAICSFL